MNDACSSLTQVLATVDENGNVKQTYLRGLGLISYSESLGNEGNEITYYISDGRGSVTALLKEGSITDRYHYDAYGNLIKKSGSSENEYLYNGESYSETTGLYYQRARYMNPTTGTFISMDAYSGTTDNPVSQHKYLYANANPVMYEDPSGYRSMMECLMSMSMSQILIGCSMIGSVFGYADAALGGGNIFWGIIKGALQGLGFGMAFWMILHGSALASFIGTVHNVIATVIYGFAAVESFSRGNNAQGIIRGIMVLCQDLVQIKMSDSIC